MDQRSLDGDDGVRGSLSRGLLYRHRPRITAASAGGHGQSGEQCGGEPHACCIADLGGELERLDPLAGYPPGGELAGIRAQDQVRASLPEPDVLDVRPRRLGLRLRMRVEDGELVALVLEEEVGRVARSELEAVRACEHVLAGEVALGDAVPKRDQPAGFVRRLLSSVRDELLEDRGRDYHQTACSIARSTSSASHSGAERYFQPASARTATTTPSSTSSAKRRATWRTPPEETPAKIPSLSRRARIPATASAFETSSFRSSCSTSRIGGTYPSSSDRRPRTGSPGIGSAAATTTSGKRSGSRRPAPISVPPVPSPATRTSIRSRS